MDRRRLVWGTASVAGALVLCPLVAPLPWQRREAPWSSAGRLTGILRNPASAARVGHAYLQQHPGEAGFRQLLEGLVGGWGEADGWLERAGPGELRSRLREQVRADFTARRTVRVQGWVLAQSEARLFALAALITGRVEPC